MLPGGQNPQKSRDMTMLLWFKKNRDQKFCLRRILHKRKKKFFFCVFETVRQPNFKIEKSENFAGSYFSEISDSAGFYFSEKLPRIWAGFYFLVKNFSFALFLHCKMLKIFPARFARRGFIFLRNFLGGVLFF